MIKNLNKNTVHEHLLKKEKLLELKTKPKYSDSMSTTRNGRWLSQVRFYVYPFFIFLLLVLTLKENIVRKPGASLLMLCVGRLYEGSFGVTPTGLFSGVRQ